MTTATKKTKPTTTTPGFSILKKSTCPTLSLSGTIGYEIANDNADGFRVRLISNTGNGFFSKAWITLDSVIDALEQFQAEYPITSLALKDLYSGSLNSWSFMMAVLLAEGLVEPMEDNKRRYQLCDTSAFLASLDKLKASHQSPPHSASRKGKAKAKG